MIDANELAHQIVSEAVAEVSEQNRVTNAETNWGYEFGEVDYFARRRGRKPSPKKPRELIARAAEFIALRVPPRQAMSMAGYSLTTASRVKTLADVLARPMLRRCVEQAIARLEALEDPTPEEIAAREEWRKDAFRLKS